MRLPWPFGRTQRSASASDAGGGTSGSLGASTSPERPSGRAWRDLPPLAETIAPPPLVAPNRPFAAELASNEPPPILAPLSHGRSLEAPRGLVVGLARPTQSAAGSPLPPPVQRSPLGGASRITSEVMLPFTDGPGESASSSIAPPAPPSSSVSSEPATPPVRRLAAAGSAPPRDLTRAPEPSRRGALGGVIGQPSAAGQAPRLTAEAGGAATVQRAPAAGASAKAAPPSITAGTSPAAGVAGPRPGAPRLTIGQARRLGLGAPISGGPIAPGAATQAGVQRAPIDLGSSRAAPAPLPPHGASTQRAPAESIDLPLAAVHQNGDGHDHREHRPAPQRAPVRDPSTESAEPALARPIAPPSGPAAASDVPSRPSPMRTSPIVSAQRLRSAVQRTPLTLPTRASDEATAASGGAPALPTPKSVLPGGAVKIHRGSEASELSSALDARSFTHGGEIFMPDSHGPLTTGKGRALLAHELTHVGQQRRLGSNLPLEHTPTGRALEAEAVAAERAPDMTLASPPDSGSRSAEAPASSTEIQGSLDGLPAPGPGAGTSPQRAPVAAGARRSESRSEQAASGAGQGRTDQELEVLAHQLYQRIGRHLRRELLVDRERSGFALDLP